MKNTNSHITTKWITRTGLFTALVVLAQFIGKFFIPAGFAIAGPFNLNQLITGSLVNLVLILSATCIGIGSGISVGILSAVLATLLGIGPIFPIITPAIAAANAIIAIIVGLSFAAAHKQRTSWMRYTGVVAGAAAKCGFLWLVVPQILKFIPDIKPAQTTMLTIMFSWPQAITALVGGLIALLIYPTLSRALRS